MPALFEAFVSSWLATVGIAKLKASGFTEYAAICRNHLVPYFGDMPIEGIDLIRVQEYVASKISCGLAPRTVRNHLEVLRLLLEHAVRCGIVAKNPVVRTVIPRVERAEMRYLTPDGLRRVIDATQPSWRLLVAFAALTGLRKGEQLALTFRDIDFEAQTIRVSRSMKAGVVSSPKTWSSVAAIPLPEALVPMLEERRRKVLDPEGLVFCRHDGRPLPDSLPNAVLGASLVAAGLPPMRWHDLRHSWVVAHLAAGTDIPTLVRLGRWKSADVLLSTYAHVLPTAGGDAVRKFDRFLAGE